jgi:ankyrin repeat protein
MQIKKDLITSVFAGNSRQVASAVRRGTNVNVSFRGRTILLWAIQERHLNVVKALIRAGASVEARDKHGFTPLGHAASDGNLEAVEFLLKSGANVNRRSAGGSPLHSACAWSQLKIVKVLLAHGANPSALDEDGRTPLYFTKMKNRRKIKNKRIDRAIGKLLKTAISSCAKI